MKLLHIQISDELDKELSSFPNKSHVVREALQLYNEHITTDTVGKLRVAFSKMSNDIEQLDAKLDRLLTKLEEISYR